MWTTTRWSPIAAATLLLLLASTVEAQLSPILLVTAPVPGGTVTGPGVLVQGTLTVAPGLEAGVTVNGVRALVGGGGIRSRRSHGGGRPATHRSAERSQWFAS